ncbi:DHHC palmitoyltransferase-domain-containing protein [Roridomyces roridus]|uniref:Palmitoyltransferase n=1 Tax=Roridomyces roridus TaxID=1738132 RepID=A0AAD7BX57_9AGAR|nr:DHHC palmitoyltransferase-domain-containing protein [Roridomyces roridus]
MSPGSRTHAGGIQPSASFFRPVRPVYHPPSIESANQHVYNLGPLSNGSEEPLTSVENHTTENEDTKQRPRPSREPLLPLVSRPSLSRPSASSSSRLVRNSLERVFSLRRGLSVDSLHKARSPREGEEHGMFDLPSASGYNKSTAAEYSEHITPSASPAPSFMPPLKEAGPPRCAKPIIDPKTQKPLRNYQLHPSRNHFFFGGRLLTGGDSPWAFLGTLFLLFGLTGTWFGTTAVYWWHHVSPAVAAVGVYLALITISSMLATATRDPGILPRDIDPDPPFPTTSPSDGGMRAPMPRDLKVRADVVRVKYCPTCKTYRPPRSSHCKMCDNCVDGCDHHCQWVNNCIGRRNYTTFFVLLFSATTTLVLVIVTSAIHLYLLVHWNHLAFKDALRHGAGSAVVFSVGILVIWPVAALLSYHMRLLLLNVTTIEQIRNQAHKSLVPGPAPPNPFSHGSWRRNLLAVLCRPVGYSWLDAGGEATRDEREINPGLVEG